MQVSNILPSNLESHDTMPQFNQTQYTTKITDIHVCSEEEEEEEEEGEEEELSVNSNNVVMNDTTTTQQNILMDSSTLTPNENNTRDVDNLITSAAIVDDSNNSNNNNNNNKETETPLQEEKPSSKAEAGDASISSTLCIIPEETSSSKREQELSNRVLSLEAQLSNMTTILEKVLTELEESKKTSTTSTTNNSKKQSSSAFHHNNHNSITTLHHRDNTILHSNSRATLEHDDGDAISSSPPSPPIPRVGSIILLDSSASREGMYRHHHHFTTPSNNNHHHGATRASEYLDDDDHDVDLESTTLNSISLLQNHNTSSLNNNNNNNNNQNAATTTTSSTNNAQRVSTPATLEYRSYAPDYEEELRKYRKTSRGLSVGDTSSVGAVAPVTIVPATSSSSLFSSSKHPTTTTSSTTMNHKTGVIANTTTTTTIQHISSEQLLSEKNYQTTTTGCCDENQDGISLLSEPPTNTTTTGPTANTTHQKSSSPLRSVSASGIMSRNSSFCGDNHAQQETIMEEEHKDLQQSSTELPLVESNNDIAGSISHTKPNKDYGNDKIGGESNTITVHTSKSNTELQSLIPTTTVTPTLPTKNRLTSFVSFFKNLNLDSLKQEGSATEDSDAAMEEFLRVPSRLEVLLFFGNAICLDSLLHMWTIIPIKFVWSCMCLLCTPLTLPLFPKYKLHCRWSFHRRHLYTILRVFVIYFVYTYCLCPISIGKLYHWIRGQAMLKLYVLMAMVEVFDRLMCSLGQDALDSLYWNTTRRPYHPRMVISTIVVLVYASIHSVILFIHVATLNVAMNSSDHALLTLLISGNFAEIKSTVFKKYAKPNLFQITTSDICERFKLGLFLGLVLLLNCSQGGMNQALIYAYIYTSCIIIVAEIICDWIKHSFITKFNFIQSSAYSDFALILAGDITGVGHGQDGVNIDQSHAAVKRLGFAQIPLVCVMARYFREAARYVDILSDDDNNDYNVFHSIALAWSRSHWSLLATYFFSGFTAVLVVKILLGHIIFKVAHNILTNDPDDDEKRRK